MMDDKISSIIRKRIQDAEMPFFANDNISKYIQDGELDLLQQEVEVQMESLLKTMVIDTENDHNTKGTAKRVAKMYMQEVFKGRYQPCPPITEFPNAKNLDEVCVVGPITIRSACSHHLVPIIGQCWVGFIPGKNVIGISKFNRLVDWIMSRPHIQEEAAIMIADEIEKRTNPQALGVIIKAQHLCMTWRGVKESQEAVMTNSIMRGKFRTDASARSELMQIVRAQGF